VIGFWRRAARFRAVVPIMISLGLICTGTGLMTVATSLGLSGPGSSASTLQVVLTASPLGFLAGCLIARPLVARFGHERTFLAMALLTILAAISMSLTASTAVWAASRFINGLGLAAIFVVCESWINLYAEDHNRGRYFSLYMLVTVLSTLLSQLLVEIAGPHSPYLFQIAAVTIGLGLGHSLIVGGRWPALPPGIQRADAKAASPALQRYGLRQLILLAPVTIFGILQSGITNSNVFVMTPIYGAQAGIDAATTITLITAFSVGGLVAQAPVGWLSDRFDRRLILMVQGFLAALSCVCIGWLGNRAESLLLVLFFTYGAAAMTIYPVAIAFANSRLDSRDMVSASGAFLLLYSFANVITPGLAAELMERFAPAALFVLLASGAGLVAVAAGLNLRRPAQAMSVPRPMRLPGASE
jgi:MFS family permease